MQIEKINNDRILLWDRSHMDHLHLLQMQLYHIIYGSDIWIE